MLCLIGVFPFWYLKLVNYSLKNHFKCQINDNSFTFIKMKNIYQPELLVA